MLKNIIVYEYDNNIVNICFKVKAKKDNGQTRAKRAENSRLRGDQSHSGVGLQVNLASVYEMTSETSG